MKINRRAIEAEVGELTAILSAIPEDSVIERLSFERRLEEASRVLDESEGLKVAEKFALTFRGAPVLGSLGMSAHFASKATGAFADAFSAIIASMTDDLHFMGPIPDRDRNQLLITGTAIGSFGFEFELPDRDAGGDNQSFSVQAIEDIMLLCKKSATGTDDDIAEVVDRIHPRAVKKVSEFLGVLVQQRAWCSLTMRDRQFRYKGLEQLKTSLERLADTNIHEFVDEYEGEFQGILPMSRSFEFAPSGDKEVIKGKIGASIDDPSALNREWLNRQAVVTLTRVQVGSSRPRFTLQKMDDVRDHP